MTYLCFKIDNLGRFKGQHKRTLLPLGTILPQRMTSHHKIGIVPMRARQGTPEASFLRCGLFQFFAECFTQLFFRSRLGRIVQIRFFSTSSYLPIDLLQLRYQTLQITYSVKAKTSTGQNKIFIPGRQLGRIAAFFEQLIALLQTPLIGTSPV